MDKTKTDKLMKILSGLSAVLILIGAILKINQSPYGFLLIIIGFISASIIDNIVIRQLKKVIKQMEKNDEKEEII